MHRPFITLTCIVITLAPTSFLSALATASTDAGPLTAISVEPSRGGTPEPVLSFRRPLAVSRTRSRVVVDGSGEPLQEGSMAVLHHVIVDGRTGELVQSSYRGPSEIAKLDNAHALPAIVAGLVGTNVGSRVLIAVSPRDTNSARRVRKALGKRPTVKRTDTLLFLFDVEGVRRPLERATGDPVPVDPNLPGVTRDALGRPSLATPVGAAPSTLVTQTLIQGTGPPIASGQTVLTHYRGWIWASGRQVDSSWDRTAPINFKLGAGEVLPGWDTALVGTNVGSQVMLILPPDKGYGRDGQPQAGVTGTDTLVFVIDVVDAF